MINIVGWDIGGVNVKAASLALEGGKASHVRVASQPFDMWREKDRTPDVLRSVFAGASFGSAPQAMAVTMTAELADIFPTKREGVEFVLESVETCFPDLASFALNLSGDFLPLSEARNHPLDFAAANWLASALWIARQFPDCLLVDVGSTTTDIIPILDAQVNTCGRTDMARLSSGELVYTGFLRTNLAAVVQSVPIAGQFCRVASEYFAVSGDVHMILGHLNPEDFNCTTPDGQPPSVDSARKRLARLVCADTEMLSTAEIDDLARYIYFRQIHQIREGLEQVLSRLPRLRGHPVIVLGAGAFLGAAAAGSMGLKIGNLPGNWGRCELAAVPCLGVAHLLAEQLEAGPR